MERGLGYVPDSNTLLIKEGSKAEAWCLKAHGWEVKMFVIMGSFPFIERYTLQEKLKELEREGYYVKWDNTAPYLSFMEAARIDANPRTIVSFITRKKGESEVFREQMEYFISNL